MKILYITPLWSGLKPFFYESQLKNSGMPAFYNIFINLLKDPKVEIIYVYLFVYRDNKEINIPKEFKGKLVVKKIVVISRVKLYLSFIKSYITGVRLIKKEKIDFIYGHGTISFLSSIIGIRTKARHYRRIYGTFLYPKLLKKKNFIFSDFFEYLSFRLPTDGLIVTNDGTSGDKIFNFLNKNTSKFHFLLNGVNKEPLIFNDFGKFQLEEDYFTYVARIDEWKRQDLLIKVLGELIKDEIDFPHTYLIGPIYSKDYKIKLEELIIQLNLSSKVTICGAVNKDEANYLLKNSLLSFSLYDFSNLGNVFLEGLSLGTPMMAINEYNSLDYFPEDIYIPIKKADYIEIKSKIKDVLNGSIDLESIKVNSLKFSKQHILSWEERIIIEKKLIINGILS